MLPRLRGMSAAEHRAVILLCQLLEWREQCRNRIGPVDVHLGAKDSLYRIDIHQPWAYPLHVFREQRQVCECKRLRLVVLIGALVQEGNLTQVSTSLA